MDEKWIIQKIQQIQEYANDGRDADAHIREDELRELFIQYLAAGIYTSMEQVLKCAKLIAATEDIEFDRWYE